MTSWEPRRCCEAVRSAILATAWLLDMLICGVQCNQFTITCLVIQHRSTLYDSNLVSAAVSDEKRGQHTMVITVRLGARKYNRILVSLAYLLMQWFCKVPFSDFYFSLCNNCVCRRKTSH